MLSNLHQRIYATVSLLIVVCGVFSPRLLAVTRQFIAIASNS